MVQVRCGIYCRVSVVEASDPEQNSIETQRSICQHYVEVQREKGWVVAENYEDVGCSGRDLDRPAMQRLLRDVRSGAVQVVISYKTDRISRSLKDMVGFLGILEDAGATFVAATQAFGTSNSSGALLLNVLMSFAEFERQVCIERTQARMRSRAQRGLWNGGVVPLGYSYDNKEQLLRPDPDEAAVVRTIFDLAIEHGRLGIVRDLVNSAGHRTKVRRTSASPVGGRAFTYDGIRGIVRRPLYAGFVRCGDELFPGVHEPLVTEETWRAANHAVGRADRGSPCHGSSGRDQHVHLLKGILHCGHCGTMMTPHPAGKASPSGQQFSYYVCTDALRRPSDSGCPIRRLPAGKLDDAIVHVLTDLSRDPRLLLRAAERGDAAASSELGSAADRRERRQSELAALGIWPKSPVCAGVSFGL